MHKKSILMLHLAVMFFGLSGVAAKFVGASAVLVTFGRSAVSACLLLLFLIIKKEPLRLDRAKDALLLAAAGLVLAVHWTTFFQSVKIASVAIGTITFSTYPLFLTFIEPPLFREPFRKISLLYAALLLAGVLITIPDFSLADSATLGILWGMAGSLSYAALTLMNRALSARYSGAKICLYEQAVAAAALLPAVLVMGERPTPSDLAGIAAIGTICTALAFSLFVSAQKHVKAQTAGIVAGMETVYGILFAWLLLGAAPTLRECIGGLIILCTAFAATQKKQTASSETTPRS